MSQLQVASLSRTLKIVGILPSLSGPAPPLCYKVPKLPHAEADLSIRKSLPLVFLLLPRKFQSPAALLSATPRDLGRLTHFLWFLATDYWLLRPSSFPVLLNQFRHQSGPAGLMARAYARSIVAVEVFVKRNEVAPVGVGLKLFRAAKDRPPPLRVACKDPGEAL